MSSVYVWSVQHYRYNTWTMKNKVIKRLQEFEMLVRRRLEKNNWTHRVINEDVLRVTEENRMLINTI